jgi:hypothetical protein
MRNEAVETFSREHTSRKLNRKWMERVSTVGSVGEESEYFNCHVGETMEC